MFGAVMIDEENCKACLELALEIPIEKVTVCLEKSGEVPEALMKFLKFVGAGLDESTEDYKDDYVRRLQASVAHVKTNREMEARYMLWRELINEEREEAKEEGRIEGRIQMLIEMLEDLPGDMPEALKARNQQEEDLNVLKEYVRLARKVSAIEEFEELIKDTI